MYRDHDGTDVLGDLGANLILVQTELAGPKFWERSRAAVLRREEFVLKALELSAVSRSLSRWETNANLQAIIDGVRKYDGDVRA